MNDAFRGRRIRQSSACSLGKKDADVATLDDCFWDDPRTLRWAGNQMCYNAETIHYMRTLMKKGGPTKGPQLNLVIQTFGRDFATTYQEYGGAVQARLDWTVRAALSVDGLRAPVLGHGL